MNRYKSDQYAEAATGLIMRQDTVAMGEAVPESSPEQEISREPDEKCRKQIKRGLRRQRFQIVSKTALRYAKRVAIFVLMLLGIVGILFTTVEAVRVPIINFFIEEKEGYLEITAEQNIPWDSAFSAQGKLKLPAGYIPVKLERSSSGNVFAMYENAEGAHIIFSVAPGNGVMTVDSANVEYISVLSHPAVLVEKNVIQLVWIDQENGLLYHLEADALTRDQIIDMAESVENSP